MEIANVPFVAEKGMSLISVRLAGAVRKTERAPAAVQVPGFCIQRRRPPEFLARLFRGSSENNAGDFLQCILFSSVSGCPRSGGKLILIKYKQIVEGHFSPHPP